LYTGGSGEVILANLPDEKIEKFLKGKQLIPYAKILLLLIQKIVRKN